jgi:hypothetical protein
MLNDAQPPRRAEHEDIAGERITAQSNLHQGGQTVHAASKINRHRPNEHPDPGRWRDHARLRITSMT